ncbi:hypothetical protein ABTL03_19880, partial [Acinetobacter baumannii]
GEVLLQALVGKLLPGTRLEFHAADLHAIASPSCSWRSGVAGKDLRDMQHTRARIACAAQSAFDVEHAPNIAKHHGISAAG